MTRVINIIHFRKDKTNTRLVVDEYTPERRDDGYVDEGYFYIAMFKGDVKVAMKLSEAEAALLALRLGEAVRQHSIALMDLQAEAQLAAEASAKNKKGGR